jgi:hypothetical protein
VCCQGGTAGTAAAGIATVRMASEGADASGTDMPQSVASCCRGAVLWAVPISTMAACDCPCCNDFAAAAAIAACSSALAAAARPRPVVTWYWALNWFCVARALQLLMGPSVLCVLHSGKLPFVMAEHPAFRRPPVAWLRLP